MRKEIAPEQYNYNKFPGPVFVSFENIVKSEDILLTLVENVKNAFDATVFSQKFTHLLLKYDYIVGDWGHEQLRLRGFYKADKPVPSQFKSDYIDIYLKEYCQYGCAYFILENPEPRDLPKEDEGRPRRRRRRSQGNRQGQERSDKRLDRAEKKATGSRSDKSFKDRRDSKSQRSKGKGKERRSRDNDHQGSKSHFVIRQK